MLQLLFLSMINRLGEQAAAAHGVAIRIESLSYLPAVAFQMGAATLAGQYLGAGDPASAVRSVRLACGAGIAVMLGASVGMYFGSDALPGIFVGGANVEVSLAAAPLLRIISLALVPLVILNVLSGALRGAGDTRRPLAITIVGFVGVRMPLALWLMFDRGEGVEGAWHAMAIDLYIRSILIAGRFLQGGWMRVRV
jgi:Na+-driven multidrug efflux pump